MDEQFDRLSRAMAGSLPRRHALKLIAATAAGMGAAVLGLRPVMVDAACTGTCSTSGVCNAPCCTDPHKARAVCPGSQTGKACTCS